MPGERTYRPAGLGRSTERQDEGNSGQRPHCRAGSNCRNGRFEHGQRPVTRTGSGSPPGRRLQFTSQTYIRSRRKRPWWIPATGSLTRPAGQKSWRLLQCSMLTWKPFDPNVLPRGRVLSATCEQGRNCGKPVVATADPTCCSGSRATVKNGTGGRRSF